MSSGLRALYSRHRRLAAAVLAMPLLLAGAFFVGVRVYPEQASATSRRLIGNEATLKVEGAFFSVQDAYGQLKFRAFGGSGSPFEGEGEQAVLATSRAPASADDAGLDEELTPLPAPTPPKPAPMPLPEVRQLRSELAAGEGVWTAAGLPRSTPEDMLMARTFVRPDPARDAAVGVLLLDKRRIRLHIVGGTKDPGGDRGVKGPGVIPEADRANLLVAWNGGFQGPHGNNSMFGVDYRGLPTLYRPLRDGLASVVVGSDGTVRIGQWGRDIGMAPDTVAVRQNVVLLVENCQVSKRTGEGNSTWGYVSATDTAAFITSRSAIGLTANGDLLVASGTNLSAATLARSMWAAGACWAMQLDINVAWVVTSLFFPQENGTLKAEKFMPKAMTPDPAKFLKTQERDFMYVTLDETNYLP